jgi:hypothetical protein
VRVRKEDVVGFIQLLRFARVWTGRIACLITACGQQGVLAANLTHRVGLIDEVIGDQ